MHKYKEGDIGVRLNNTNATGRPPIGTMYKAVKDFTSSGCAFYYNKEGASMMYSHVRPATQTEINAYNRGIRNINDIPKIIDYEVYG